MADDAEAQLKEAIERILASGARKKLIIAGPRAGKTTLFEQLLDSTAGDTDERIVLTFINNLKTDLEDSLGEAAHVFTLHGYCQHLLHTHANLRNGLSGDFRCYPGLTSIIKKDWLWLKGFEAPEFVSVMRELLLPDKHEAFYFARANYYDAVDFDDSVYRTWKQLAADTSIRPTYELVLIDEFQDFNKLEAAVIDLLAEQNSIVVAGDDDQALYSQLRGASWDHIRARYASGNYETFVLPFCMRCPQVIVEAVNDVIANAQARKKLNGRIDKPYRYFEPVKGDDSRRYPQIELIKTSVQRVNANYFGRYIEQCIREIPADDFKLADKKCESAVLVIGSNPYRRQVEAHLTTVALVERNAENKLSDRERALEILNQDPASNLGWRIILAEIDVRAAREKVQNAAVEGTPLVEVISTEEREAIIKEAEEWASNQEQKAEGAGTSAPRVKITSFEGAKGMSAQYVFLIGLQSGDMPRNAADIQDLEICRFLVGLTRTKKKCCILTTARFGEHPKRPSEFLSWIKPEHFYEKEVNAAYWRDGKR